MFWYSGMLLQPTLLGCVQVLYTLLAHVVQHPPSQLPVLHAELDQVINQRRMFTQNAHTHTPRLHPAGQARVLRRAGPRAAGG